MKKLQWILILAVSGVAIAQDDEVRDDLHTPRIHKKISEEKKLKGDFRPWNFSSSSADLKSWREKGWGFAAKFGYQNSQYNDVTNSLSNGSLIWGLSLYRKSKDGRLRMNYGLDFLSSKDDNILPENTKVFQLRVQPEYNYFISDRLQTFAGLGLLVADYNLEHIGANSVVSNFGSGTALGLAADFGMRVAFGKTIAADLAIGYSQYFGTPEKELGGFSVVPRVSFNF